MITELYERLHLDVTEFDEEDVITTSSDEFEDFAPNNKDRGMGGNGDTMVPVGF